MQCARVTANEGYSPYLPLASKRSCWLHAPIHYIPMCPGAMSCTAPSDIWEAANCDCKFQHLPITPEELWHEHLERAKCDFTKHSRHVVHKRKVHARGVANRLPAMYATVPYLLATQTLGWKSKKMKKYRFSSSRHRFLHKAWTEEPNYTFATLNIAQRTHLNVEIHPMYSTRAPHAVEPSLDRPIAYTIERNLAIAGVATLYCTDFLSHLARLGEQSLALSIEVGETSPLSKRCGVWAIFVHHPTSRYHKLSSLGSRRRSVSSHRRKQPSSNLSSMILVRSQIPNSSQNSSLASHGKCKDNLCITNVPKYVFVPEILSMKIE